MKLEDARAYVHEMAANGEENVLKRLLEILDVENGPDLKRIRQHYSAGAVVIPVLMLLSRNRGVAPINEYFLMLPNFAEQPILEAGANTDRLAHTLPLYNDY